MPWLKACWPSELAKQLVEKELAPPAAVAPLEALRGLARLRSQLPAADAVAISRQARQALSRRGHG